MKFVTLMLFLNAAYGAFTIQPDPNCIIKGKIDYLFGGRRSIDRPINCAVNEKSELTFCEGDEIKSPLGKNKMTVLTLVPNDEMVYVFAPNYGHNNQDVEINSVVETQKLDCQKRLEALTNKIKLVVLNEANMQKKSKE